MSVATRDGAVVGIAPAAWIGECMGWRWVNRSRAVGLNACGGTKGGGRRSIPMRPPAFYHRKPLDRTLT